jgi:hypothetical protein
VRDRAKAFSQRWLFVYFIVFLFPAPISSLPKLDGLDTFVSGLWGHAVRWASVHVIACAQPVVQHETGSGDAAFNYVQVFLWVCIATLVAALWFACTRGQLLGSRAQRGLRYYVALTLGVALLPYGIEKLLLVQMESPSPVELMRPLGTLTPTSLVWAMVGSSPFYQSATGFFETLGAALVVFPRTRRLGAMVLLPVLTYVVLLDIAFDIAVRLYALHLLALTVFVIAPDLGRITDVIVLHRVPPPEAIPASGFPGRVGKGLAMLSAIVFVLGAATVVQRCRKVWERTARQQRALFYGVFAVEDQATGADRWVRLGMDGEELYAERADGSAERYFAEVDEEHGEVKLRAADDYRLHGDASTAWTLKLAHDAEQLTLNGAVGTHAVHVKLTKTKQAQPRLTAPGHHWVQEYPDF